MAGLLEVFGSGLRILSVSDLRDERGETAVHLAEERNE
jgi:hypothetical protein